MALPSKDRIEPGSVNVPVGKFPTSCSSTGVDADTIASEIIRLFNTALGLKQHQEISKLFLEDGFWRDHLVVTWNFRTVKGQENISKFLQENPRLVQVEIDRSSAFRAPTVFPIDAFGDVTGIQFFIKVTTDEGSGKGVVRLAEKDGEWKIFTFYTSLQEIKGSEEKVNSHRPVGVQHGEHHDRRNWQDRRTADLNYEGKHPTVLIVGMISLFP
jgi:hypothetical protein